MAPWRVEGGWRRGNHWNFLHKILCVVCNLCASWFVFAVSLSRVFCNTILLVDSPCKVFLKQILRKKSQELRRILSTEFLRLLTCCVL